MNRILIIGNGGAGKSTFAKALGQHLNLPVDHLDKEYWQPGWVATPRQQWLEKLHKILQPEKWILDGNFDSTLAIRIPPSDAIIFLDFNPFICLWRILKRRMKYRNTNRPELSPGCNE